ncbi:MAG: DUF3179 domain-containing protein [Cohaesibacter sp.]|nr:DUF3179 domain-containing protein [Cohaesibacter sp.]MCV6600695.1 DUF3179 domain-containing protein [Cohaesibacter sp.]
MTDRFAHLFAVFLLVVIALGSSVIAALASPDRWKQEGWKTDFQKSGIAFDEILSGGPPKDGIPSIDDPKFRPASSIEHLSDQDPVIRLDIKGDIRAYPLQVLTWHEIVNDVVGGVPVAITYCPLCNASIAFERSLSGQVLEFGTTGKLRKSDLVMYDRQTQSWWQQFTGEAIVGQLQGRALTMVPVRVVSFGDFKAEAADGKVLVPNNPSMRPYGRNPYVKYDSRNTPYPLFTGDLPQDINPMARVVVFEGEGKQQAVSLAKVREAVTFKHGDVILSWKKGVASALDSETISQSRDVGSVRVIRQENGKETDIVHDVTFAFVFYAFHPDGTLIK